MGRSTTAAGVLFAALAAIAVGTLDATARRAALAGEGLASIGPDVIVGSLPNTQAYGTIDGISAYAIGTTSCNIGDAHVLWCDMPTPDLCEANQHPVIAQNLYRLMDGRFEQIGMSWVKHGFCAYSESLCGTCQPDPFACQALGVGCSDPYDAALNGVPNFLGPRSQVNAASGAVVYPFSAPAAPPVIGRRLQVPVNDLTPAMNPGALYFAEGIYIAGDDAAAGNDDNNASYRRVLVGAPANSSWALSMDGPTYQQLPAIHAWRDHGLGIDVPDPSVSIVPVDLPGDGRLLVAARASQTGPKTWRYDYAVLNLNSDRSVRSLTIQMAPGASPTGLDQHLVAHHSGEPYSTAEWTPQVACGVASWSTSTFEANPNANALRWGTMFNFWFEADRPPTTGVATLGLFKPGTALDPSIFVPVPSAPPAGDADLDSDGDVDGADLGVLLSKWGAGGVGDLDGSGMVDGADIGLMLVAWVGC